MSDLKTQLIKLGSTNPELRPHIRPLLKVANKYSRGRFEGTLAATQAKIWKDLHNNAYPENVEVYADPNLIYRVLEKEILRLEGVHKASKGAKGVNVLTNGGGIWEISLTPDRGYMQVYFASVSGVHTVVLNYPDTIIKDLDRYNGKTYSTGSRGIVDITHDHVPKSTRSIVKDFEEMLRIDGEDRKRFEDARKKQEEAKREQAKPGAITFSQYESGTDANQLFRRMQKEDKEEADYERNQDMWGDQSNSGGGWTGPKPTHIYQKRGFEIVGEAESDREAYMMAEKMLKKNPLRGPAWAIEVKRNGRTEGFRFFGTL